VRPLKIFQNFSSYNYSDQYGDIPFISEYTLTIAGELNGNSMIDLNNDIPYSSHLGINKLYDYYTLKPSSPLNDLLRIEISTCSGNIKYELSENITKAGTTKEEIGDTKIYQVTHYLGKTILTTSSNSGANHYLKVFEDPALSSKRCDPNGAAKINCTNSMLTVYSVKYYSGMSNTYFSYMPKGGGNINNYSSRFNFL
jgi:hypothetical protein